jgi:hypothetical protein
VCRGPLEVLEAGAVEIVLPLMRAVVERGESLVQRMHDQDFGKEGAAAAPRGSPHIQELCRHLSHSRSGSGPRHLRQAGTTPRLER